MDQIRTDFFRRQWIRRWRGPILLLHRFKDHGHQEREARSFDAEFATSLTASDLSRFSEDANQCRAFFAALASRFSFPDPQDRSARSHHLANSLSYPASSGVWSDCRSLPFPSVSGPEATGDRGCCACFSCIPLFPTKTFPYRQHAPSTSPVASCRNGNLAWRSCIVFVNKFVAKNISRCFGSSRILTDKRLV